MKFFGQNLLQKRKIRAPKPVHQWKIQPKHPELFIPDPKLFPKSSFFRFQPQTKPQTQSMKELQAERLLIGRNDIQTALLIKELEAQKLAFVYIDWDELSFQGEFTTGSGDKAALKIGRNWLDLSNVKKLFITIPYIDAALEETQALSLSEKVQLKRWMSVFYNLSSMMPRRAIFYPCTPNLIGNRAQNRISDRKLAQSLGFKIPEFICTNDSKALQIFFKKMNSCILFREIDNQISHQEHIRSFQMQKVTSLTQISKKQLMHSPCYFEEYIEKAFEVRAYVIGNQVLACRIDSQASDKAKSDWREYDFDHVRFGEMKLPSQISARLKKFAKMREMKFASFDLIFSVNQEVHFLEMNRPGAWGFIEALSGVGITRALARLMK